MTVLSFWFQRTEKPYDISSFVTEMKLNCRCSHYHQSRLDTVAVVHNIICDIEIFRCDKPLVCDVHAWLLFTKI